MPGHFGICLNFGLEMAFEINAQLVDSDDFTKHIVPRWNAMAMEMAEKRPVDQMICGMINR